MENKQVMVSKEKIQCQKEYLGKLRTLIKGQDLTAYVRTYGCQQNVSDGEKLKGTLTQAGYKITDTIDGADFVLFNTCAIRENAESKVFGNIGELKISKKENPNMLIGICGCMTQQEHISKKIKDSYPHVDMVFGTHALYKLPELLHNKLMGQKHVFDIENCDGEIAENLPLLREDGQKANLPIMYGCNNFCTYCIVPYVRGRERSRDEQTILIEAKKLVAKGYKEITLLGQNVNSYGDGVEFPNLLRKLNAIDGDFIIRFMTSHPKDCTKELIDTIAECDKVSKHLHLPVQSGSNKILKAMNRHYTIENYLELVDYAKEKIEKLALTSDIIVGFPGETEEDFLETLKLVEKVRYHSLFTFIYSKRVGTKAALMEDNISHEEKGRWINRLLDKQKLIGREIYDSYVGSTERLFIDAKAKRDGYLTARNNANMLVEIQTDESNLGICTEVEITGAKNGALLGTLVI